MEKIDYQGIAITVEGEDAISLQHLPHDYEVLIKYGIDRVTKERFLPWLLNEQFADRNPEKVKEGLRIYEITYRYGRIIGKYSPTRKDDDFGQFAFSFQSCSPYTQDLLEAAEMVIYICREEIVNLRGYDI